MTFKINHVWVGIVFALGCGGGGGGDTGGLDPNELLNQVTQAQAQQLCDSLESQYPAKTVDCGGGVTFTIGFGSGECGGSNFTPAPAGCTATVGEDVDCLAAIYDGGSAVDCGSAEPSACADVDTAACEGSD